MSLAEEAEKGTPEGTEEAARSLLREVTFVELQVLPCLLVTSYSKLLESCV